MWPGEIGDDENTARFLFDGSQHNATEVKYRAFLPDPHREVSVFRVSGLTKAGILQISVAHVEPNRGKRTKGWGEITVGQIKAVKGMTVAADVNPPRHPIVSGYPSADKAARSQLAKELAAKASLVLVETA